MITPLLTQLTYEGLIDELVGIKNCKHFFYQTLILYQCIAHVEIPASILSPPEDKVAASSSAATTSTSTAALRREAKKKYQLASSDTLFAELRDLNFSLVGKHLNKVARRIDGEYKVSG